ncbi:hypothetical protein Cni_G19695 [Canna indica]|uniref:Las1-like family protein n=1 Tax=Canna indica TaxID=4628 RepID=A0AAQ3QK04_9LILI|nr:hypothetical protein Cni_G19695 [Canna indica]
MEPMMGSEGELSSGYKLVPWSSWEQWNFVKESILSSSPDAIAAALRRISAWRSRGCLPVPIDVTAALVEIQQKDPFFRRDLTNGVLESDEMLSMLYSMAIIRLVNCFVAHKKTKFSISELADAVGIPRVLVDIRHESSHRDLPSLQLVRHASIKALEWLKDNYWEPQKDVIPDVRKEIRSRLLEMTYYLKTKNSEKSSSGVKRKYLIGSGMLRAGNKLSSQITAMLQSSKSNGSAKMVSKIAKIIARLYSSYPSEVVSVLLELFQLQIHGLSESIDSNSYVGSPESTNSANDLKIIVDKLSSRRPRLLLSLLRNVLEMIEIRLSKNQNGEFNIQLSKNQAEIHYMTNLCSLIPWLIKNLKLLNNSGLVELIDETEVLPIHKNNTPKVSVRKLLQKCLTLSVLGDKHLLDSVLLLVEMTRDAPLKERLKKLPLLSLKDLDHLEGSTYLDTESMLLQEENIIRHEEEKLVAMKLKLKSHNKSMVGAEGGDSDKVGTWTVAKSWIACPIGMLPCSFSSTPVLPVLDKLNNALKSDAGLDKEKHLNCLGTNDCQTELLEHGNPIKKLKTPSQVKCIYLPQETCPLEGRLFINGTWTKVSEEELQIVQSDIRILV